MEKKVANVIIMGKTGAGKSTLVNAVLGEKLAEVGCGQKVTTENKIYNKTLKIKSEPYEFSVYDTVGLELNNKATEKTLREIEAHMDRINRDYSVCDISAVWFCINYRCQRFEKYEIELLKRLSVDSCIPFIIVITQCMDDMEGELEERIKELSPDIPVRRVLAEDKKIRDGVYKAYGVKELLDFTVSNYSELKVKLTAANIKKLEAEEREKNERMETRARACISEYAEKAGRVGWAPTICIPIVHGMAINMISDINKIYEINLEMDAADVIADIVLGMIVTPFMAVPLLSRAITETYVETIGELYLEAVMEMVEKNSNYKIENKKLILEEIKKNLKKR